MKKKAKLSPADRGRVMNRITSYLAQQLGLAQFANEQAGRVIYEVANSPEGLLAAFIMNPFEVGVHDADVIEVEDFQFCGTITAAERHVILMYMVVEANEFRRLLQSRYS